MEFLEQGLTLKDKLVVLLAAPFIRRLEMEDGHRLDGIILVRNTAQNRAGLLVDKIWSMKGMGKLLDKVKYLVFIYEIEIAKKRRKIEIKHFDIFVRLVRSSNIYSEIQVSYVSWLVSYLDCDAKSVFGACKLFCDLVDTDYRNGNTEKIAKRLREKIVSSRFFEVFNVIKNL